MLAKYRESLKSTINGRSRPKKQGSVGTNDRSTRESQAVRLASILSAAIIAAGLAPFSAAAQGACPHTVGVVVALTGPAGRFGEAAAKSVELAFKEINEVGGAARAPLPSIRPGSSSSSGTCRRSSAESSPRPQSLS
jgi:hypothetical protein